MLINLNEPQAGAGMQVAGQVVRALLVELAADPVDGTAAVVVRRVLGRRVDAVATPVDALMKFEPAARVALLDAFDADAAFSADLDRAGPYQFGFERLPADLRTTAEKLFVAMYVNVFRKKGFPRPGGTALDPDSFEVGFFAANPRLAVCPACLYYPLDKSVGGGRGKPYDIEHFFPKSVYPILAVHHHNLVPICSTCNSRMHGTIDPLDNGGRQAISVTYVPYRRAAQDEIVVRFQPTAVDPAERVELDGTCEPAKKRLQTHDRMYAVSERWGGKVEHLHSAITMSVQEFAPSLEREDVKQFLQKKAAVGRKQLTFVTNQLLEAAYCDWLASDGLSAFMAELGPG